MVVRTIVDQLDLDYSVILSESFSVAEQQKMFAEEAALVIEEAKRQNASVLGRVPKHTIAVDGREGAPLTAVRIPNGVAVIEFEITFEALFWIGEMLKEHSPVKTGRYQRSHVLLADNVAVEEGAVPPIADRYVWVNVMPYARKIERGLSSQAPDGVYQAVATLASSTKKFGNVARIKFGYETPLFGGIDKWASTSSAARLAQEKRGGRKELHGDWLRRQPAIIVTMSG